MWEKKNVRCEQIIINNISIISKNIYVFLSNCDMIDTWKEFDVEIDPLRRFQIPVLEGINWFQLFR
jgi:hypothetical protein